MTNFVSVAYQELAILKNREFLSKFSLSSVPVRVPVQSQFSAIVIGQAYLDRSGCPDRPVDRSETGISVGIRPLLDAGVGGSELGDRRPLGMVVGEKKLHGGRTQGRAVKISLHHIAAVSL